MKYRICENCGEWRLENEICESCGSDDYIDYDEVDIVDILNNYEWFRRQFKVVEYDNSYEITSKFGVVDKNNVNREFADACFILNKKLPSKKELCEVVDNETHETLYTGTHEECERYIKQHETIFRELSIIEGE